MRRTFVFGFVVGAVLAFAPACVITPRQCNANSCGGCCDANGACQSGSANAACGTAGNACTVCAGSFVCSLGQCQPTSGQGGGTGGGLGGGTGGGGAAQFGDITFLWTFNGASCAVATQVATVTVTIPGQTLANGGVYPCTTSGSDGIRLTNFANGAYSYTLEGKSSSNVVLFSATGTLTVNGDTTVSANLQPVGTVPGAAALSWTFPPNGISTTPNCAEAGVTTVNISIDSGTPLTQACTAGFGGNQVTVQNLTPGTHSIELFATDSNGFAYYRKVSTLTIVSGATTSSAYSFDWNVGSLPLKWALNDGTFDLTCAQAGVTQVRVDLQDTANNYVYGTAGVMVPCDTAGVQGTLFQFLYPDTYRVYLQAAAPGSVLYSSNVTTPPALTVTAGQFPVVDGSTPIVTMVRQ